MRAAFLDGACGQDGDLRREVESLLAEAVTGQVLLNGPHAGLPAESAAPALKPGTRIGPYRIEERISAGGMGEVYRAKDTTLRRDVALKVLPESVARDRGRLARFQREAKVLASLNHPNIAQIYGVEERALVMELVPGETLHGPLPIETALQYARQIAEALEAAHEKGIVHRDLKPANVKVTPEGVVKVLDFGLARATEESALESDASHSSTLTGAATRVGTILGTSAYMSPEQASGKPVDRRADIWSFGVVLWELLTGRRMFGGETLTQTLAEVLGGPIDFDQLPRETPAEIRRLLRRCLDRNPRSRLRDIGEARIAIEAAMAGETPLVDGLRKVGSGRHRWLGWSVAAALAIVLAPVAFLRLREQPPAPAAPVRFQIQAPPNTTLGPIFSLSPDGRKLAFLAGGRLWVHLLESGESRDLAVASGTPFWSPDSRFIGYPTQEGGPRTLRRIEATGGPPQNITDLSSGWTGGTWNPNDVIVFGGQAGLFRVPASGGVPVPITALDRARRESLHAFPLFLPDGWHFVYTRRENDTQKGAIYLGSVDATPGQQSLRPLTATTWGPAYSPSAAPGAGYLLFVREDTLMAQPFDDRRLELTGQAAPVAQQISDGRAYSVSANNVLVFQQNPASDRQLTWFDREGKVVGTVGAPGDYLLLALSPDGAQLAVTKKGRDTSNIWLMDLSRGGASTRFTFGSLKDNFPVWSPDGSRIVFMSNRDGPRNLYQKPANGAIDEEVLLKSDEDKYPTSWSRDGRFLLYTVAHPKTKNDIWVLPLDGDRKPFPFLVTQFNEYQARFSPDGHWVAYSSDESGHWEVYVRPFSMNSDGTAVEAGGKWKVSSNGFADSPRWRGDGRELYYLAVPEHGGAVVTAVDIATSPAFRAGKPQPLGFSSNIVWDVEPDGKRFLAPAGKSGPQPYSVVLNWQAGLKK